MNQPANNILVSVCLPTRGRPEGLRRCVESIFNTASRPERVEFCVGADCDDAGTRTAIQQFVSPSKLTPVFFGANNLPHGERICQYFDSMFQAAKGRWLWIMNDDGGVMPESKGWDDELAAVEGGCVVTAATNLWGQNVMRWVRWNGWHTAHFPIVPNGWWKRFGLARCEMPLDTWTLNYLTGKGFGGDGVGKGWPIVQLPSLVTFHEQKKDLTFERSGRRNFE